MSQVTLANLIGVDVTTISAAERGENVPSYPTLESMADILAVTIDQLVGRSAFSEMITQPTIVAAPETVQAIPRPILEAMAALEDRLMAQIEQVLEREKLVAPPGDAEPRRAARRRAAGE